MEELEQLITRFWANETTSVENNRLIQLLEEQKEAYRDLVKDDFNEAGPFHAQQLEPGRAREILQKIHLNLGSGGNLVARTAKIREAKIHEAKIHEAKIHGAKTFFLQRVGWPMTIAASVIVVTGLALLAGWYRVNQRQMAKNTERPAYRLIQLVNRSNAEMPVHLQDGSSIQLQKNSGLSYYEPFINDRRDISLSGIALFKVARDRTRPFTVYAGGIVTEVLGTRFLVNASDPKKVIVRLLEGGGCRACRQ